MSSKLDIVKAYTDLIRVGGDMEAAVTVYFSDDFQNFDKDGSVALDKEGILNMTRMLSASLKDYGFVLTNLRDEGDFIIMTGHFQGTHTGDLDLSAMGLGVVPASGEKIDWPEGFCRSDIGWRAIEREDAV